MEKDPLILPLVLVGSFFAILAICLIAALRIRSRMKVWLFKGIYEGEVFEMAIYSAIYPEIRKNPETGLYSWKSLGAFRKHNEYLLYDDSIDKLIGRPVQPDEPPVSIPCESLDEYYVYSAITKDMINRAFMDYIEKKNG